MSDEYEKEKKDNKAFGLEGMKSFDKVMGGKATVSFEKTPLGIKNLVIKESSSDAKMDKMFLDVMKRSIHLNKIPFHFADAKIDEEKLACTMLEIFEDTERNPARASFENIETGETILEMFFVILPNHIKPHANPNYKK